jgi:hypothetical protein
MKTSYRALIARHGLRAAGVRAAMSALNLLTRLRVFKGLVVTMQTLDKKLLDGDGGRFLDPLELEQFAQNPENDLEAGFVREAILRGDQCYAFVEGDVLSSYGWYAMYSPVVVRDTKVHFNSAYAFCYRGFTHPHFRGRNLRAVGVAKALEIFSRDGKKGLLTFTGVDEFDTLPAKLKVGYRQFGHALLVELGSRFLSFGSAGCRGYKFRLVSMFAAPVGIRVGEPGTVGLDPRTRVAQPSGR